MKNYSKEQFLKDFIAGIVVAIIALPLSIALAIASGVNPEQGLYTAIVAGFFISFLGGSRVQIGGPTAAFVTIIYGIIQQYGIDGLITATLMAGIILIIMGFCHFGSLIKYIPYTITTGFTAGIAVTLAAGQLKDFMGLQIASVPSEFIGKLQSYAAHIDSLNLYAFAIGLLAIGIHILWPRLVTLLPNKLSKAADKLPASLIAIIITTIIVKFLNQEQVVVATIGSSYQNVSNALPKFHIPNMNMEMIQNLISPAFTIAILAGIESLLSCVVSDGMIGSRHRSNMELIAQGTGNVFSALFGGIPATGAIARTAANVKNGGRTPIAGIVHSITLLFVLVVLMPLAKLIPMPTLAAVLIVVAYNMSSWREFIRLLKSSPKSDGLVLLTTFFLTDIFDLVVAIEIGMVLAAILFMKRMSEVTTMKGWDYIDNGEDDENDPDSISYKEVPMGVAVYEIIGPMFFAATDKFLDVTTAEHGKIRVVIIRMRGVPALDATALHSLENLYASCKKKNIQLLFSHVQEQPYHTMEKAGFVDTVGQKHFRKNIDDALAYANSLVS